MATLLLCVSFLAASQSGETPYIFGLHDPGGESNMSDKGKKGWILFTEALGHNPADASGHDYTSWSSQGYGIIARLNNGYGSAGTIPYESDYDVFAQRVANFVAASPGCHLWVIGNEMNLDQETPSYGGTAQPITPTLYAECFLKCRAKIKALAGHSSDSVIPGAVATYALFQNSQDWVSYHVELLTRIGQGNVDAVAIHTYTHGSDPAYITDESKFLDPRVSSLHWNFRAYRDYLAAHPTWAQTLPVYITETDQANAWLDQDNGWVKAAYREINDWNQTAGTQKIRSLCLYRWQQKDQWYIDGKWGVINDFREAMDNDYRWPGSSTSTGVPDVIVTSLSYANGLFTCTVNNRGTGATPTGVVIGVGYFVDGVERAWGTVNGPLAGGASVTIGTTSASYTIPDGTHTLMAFADDVNRFAESNESNNQLSQTITVGSTGLPDVVVTSLSYANGLFMSTVKNQGSGATPSGVAVGVAYWVDGVYRTWGAVLGPLAAGASVTIGTSGGAFAIPDGTHTLMAWVDDVNRFAESNENNNQLTQQITLGPSATSLPDVVVTSLSYSNGVFTSSVLNQGNTATPTGLSVGVGYFVDGVYRTWGAMMGPLAAGASVTIGTKGGTYFIPAGTHAITAVVDDVNRFAESSETNNSYSITRSVLVMDVAAAASDASSDPAGASGGGGGVCGALGIEILLLVPLGWRRCRIRAAGSSCTRR